MSDIYCLPGRNKGSFVQRVHRILRSLRHWDETLPAHLGFGWDTSHRHVSSLHLCYNECIIHTTRPILLFLFRAQFNLGPQHPQEQPRVFSETTLALAESCVSAARTTHKMLYKLFVDGTLATLGYWDAHYLFSSTLILIISAVMEPNTHSSDLVQTAFNLLTSIRDDGNIPASGFCDCLSQIQRSMSRLRDEPERDNHPNLAAPSRIGSSFPDAEAPSMDGAAGGPLGSRNPVGNDRFIRNVVGAEMEDFGANDFDPLANPYINDFLAEKSSAWSSNTFQDGSALQQLASELGDDFVFPTFEH